MTDWWKVATAGYDTPGEIATQVALFNPATAGFGVDIAAGKAIEEYGKQNPNNPLSDSLYNTFGIHTGKYADENYYDFAGKKVERGIARSITPAQQAQYNVLAGQLGKKMAESRINALQQKKAMGLGKTGSTFQAMNQLNAEQAVQETSIYAALLKQQQDNLDQQYARDLEINYQAEMMKREEAVARQKFWQDLGIKLASMGISLATGNVAGTVASGVGIASDIGSTFTSASDPRATSAYSTGGSANG